MRIRKHAKISSLLYDETSSSSTAPVAHHVCQLNQSPWDVLASFQEQDPERTPSPPPLFSKVDEDNDSFVVNGSFPDSMAADHKAPPLIKSEVVADDNVGGIILPSSGNGGKGCKRRKRVCEHNNSSSSSQVAAKKSEKAPLENTNSRRRPRQKKASANQSKNPYEYYYYSGFGPRWRKRRGSASTTVADTNSNGGATGDLELGEPNTPSMDMDIEERLDYIEDDEDEDDDGEIGQGGKKRIRKPIKARSLKSLM